MSTNETPATPENVAKLATERASLPRVALIGIFGVDPNPSALIRSARGKVAKVSVGDTFDGSTVSAIGSDSLVLSRRGQTKVMKLPQA